MAISELTVRVRYRGNLAILDLFGDVDSDADIALQHGYEQAAGVGAATLVLNFAGVGYINSTGIAVIVGLLARARKEHRPITAFGLSEHYRRIFTITRLSDFIELYPDENTAVAGKTAATRNADVRGSKGATA
jgi:anti-sigma B factor antagonist